MKAFRRTTSNSPERRHVVAPGRTNLYAYYARRSSEPATQGRQMLRDALNARTAQRAARYWTQRFGLLLVIVALCVAVVSILSLSTDPKVLPVDAAQPPSLHAMAAYQQTADELFAQSLLNRNKLTVDTTNISRQMQQRYPELSIVSITLPLIGQRPIIYLAQAEPVLLLEVSDGHAYVVDSTGRAIGDANNMNLGSLQLLHVRETSEAEVQLGSLALAGSTVQFIQTVQYQISHHGLHSSLYELPAGTSELDLHLQGQAYVVKFNLATNTAQQQVGSFLAVKHSLEGRGITPSDYIDVRVDGRAYYK